MGEGEGEEEGERREGNGAYTSNSNILMLPHKKEVDGSQLSAQLCGIGKGTVLIYLLQEKWRKVELAPNALVYCPQKKEWTTLMNL